MTRPDRTTRSRAVVIRLRLACLAILILAVSAGRTSVHAQTRTVEERVDALFAEWNDPNRPGAAVAVVRSGELVLARGYGAASLEYDAPITPETPFHVASVAKQFTALAIALLAQEGRLSLDDPVRRHLPDVPDFGDEITIRHLLTHTSGLRDQWSLWVLAGGRLDDVITQEDLLKLIHRQRELNFRPGSEHLYSNTGYSLLAEVVSRVSGESFRDWMQANVFEPLGMVRTQVYDDHERIVPGRAYSYSQTNRREREAGAGRYKKSVLSYANAGATSLFTTAEDLARWLANFGHPKLGGAEVLGRMVERGILARGDTLDYALGIIVDQYRGLQRLSHGGADAGYRSYVAFFPEHELGVVVLSNLASFSTQSKAMEVAELFLAGHFRDRRTGDAREIRQSIRIDPSLLDEYSATYELVDVPGFLVTFRRVQDRLLFSSAEMPGVSALPFTDSTFSIPLGGTDLTATFHRSSGSSVRKMTIRMNEQEYAGRRIEPYAPSEVDLAAYAGRYYSPELDTFYDVMVEGGALSIRPRRHDDVSLFPLEANRFLGSTWLFRVVHFERDDEGRVVGMRVSSDRVRNLIFLRQP